MKRKGISLIELIITIGISLTIFTVISAMFVQTNNIFNLESNKSHIQLSGKTALDRIARQTKQGYGVETSYGAYATSDTQMVLKLASLDVDRNIIPLTYDYVIYRLNPVDTTELEEITIADAASYRESDTRVIAKNIGSMTFTYYDSTGTLLALAAATNTKKVKIILESEEVSNKKTATATHTEQVTLRNK